MAKGIMAVKHALLINAGNTEQQNTSERPVLSIGRFCCLYNASQPPRLIRTPSRCSPITSRRGGTSSPKNRTLGLHYYLWKSEISYIKVKKRDRCIINRIG